MRYNRHDYFRYEFNPQLPAKFRLQLDGEEKKLSNEGECELLDISTGGVKFFTFLDLPLHPKNLLCSWSSPCISIHSKFLVQSSGSSPSNTVFNTVSNSVKSNE